MIVFGYRFEPKLWTIIVTVISVVIFIELGKWQLSRAEEKNIQYNQLEEFAKQPMIALPKSSIKLDDFKYREVEIEGKYLSEHTLLIDNKTYKGRAGYHVITPLEISNSTLSVAVNRGWISTGNDRTILPEAPEIRGTIKVTGIVVSPELRTLQLSEPIRHGKVWDKFDLHSYQEMTGRDFQPILILQKDKSDDGLIRDWEKPDSGASKNIGYAVQWFSLAITAIIIFLVLNVKRASTKSK
ncbi:SURF1 family protein [Nitrosomonas sp. JL21]|uniref:SURF1 family protein n=1 Tax=Nitrosomonas sp. JL21 TaxID=153949 RepID=UPI00136BC01F|nr:SURF1 family protein [Nitrosomonas sp. JL21]MBL8498608.1 SURF1 family protein [Nitrosomonas sp.]MXS78958.1 SURF1 family protein [Nitrosomonas sp. JL21]